MARDIRLTAVRRSWLENNIVYVPIHTLCAAHTENGITTVGRSASWKK